MKNIYDSEKYKVNLNKKNIKVLPLEIYQSSSIKILHKCVCGNVWQATPNSVLSGKKCGCGKTRANKLSTIDYVDNLKKKKILIVPLEEYINAYTKILHKCTCGNEWNVSPIGVIQGHRCGCISNSIKDTHEVYLKKLSKKNIVIYPIEEYRGSDVKILHKCTCGNIWKVLPLTVLKNNTKCGCDFINLWNEEFYKNKETILYYIKIKGLYKIGVTLYKDSIEKSLKKRFYRQEYEVIQTDIFKDGREAFVLEQQILEFNKSYRYLGEKVLSSGNTELFVKDIRYKI